MKIESIEHLKKVATNENDDFVHFYVVLAGGLAKSGRRIVYYPNDELFGIINEFNESHIEVDIKGMSERTNIVEAINKGCLFMSSI